MKIQNTIAGLTLIAVVMMFAFTPVVLADGGAGDGQQFAARKIEHLKQTLSLTDDQVTKVQSLVAAKAEERKAIREERQATREKFHSDLKSILTPEQIQKFDELKAERKSHRMDRRKAWKKHLGAGPQNQE